MKKTFKILSCLAVVVVAFIMSFTLISVNGADTTFEYTDNNIYLTQEGDSIDLFINDVSISSINSASSYIKVVYDNTTEITLYLNTATGSNQADNRLVLFFNADIHEITELLEYKVFSASDNIIYEYPETIPEEGGETMGGFITQVFETLGDIIEGFSSTLVSLFENVVKIFYTAPTGSETVGSLTVVGVLTLVAMGCGLVIWGFKFLRSLIRVKTK